MPSAPRTLARSTGNRTQVNARFSPAAGAAALQKQQTGSPTGFRRDVPSVPAFSLGPGARHGRFPVPVHRGS